MMGDGTVYLHTWGSRRHIAEPEAVGVVSGIALCGERGYTDEGRFRNHRPSPRAVQTILNRPLCSRCVALSDPAPDPQAAELATLRAENERLRALVADLGLHLGFLCDHRYDTRYLGDAEPCPGCYDARDAALAEVAASRPSPEGSGGTDGL